MKFLLGKKLEMSQMFQEGGAVVPVTLIQAGPVTVTQIKSADKDGYSAVQLGYGDAKRLNKPMAGHLKETKSKHLKETKLQTAEDQELKVGDKLDVSVFAVGDTVKISGFSKGKGFAGAVKRHGFAGMPASHGHHHVLRHVGSIGQRFPQHTLPGTRMAGRMGGVRTTTRGLKVVNIDTEHNIIAVKGAVPGRRGALLEITAIK